MFYEVWHTPLYTIGGGHLISQAIALCGGANAFAAETVPAPLVSVEAVLAARPQAIIAGSDGGGRPAWLDEWRRWPTLPAVAGGELIPVLFTDARTEIGISELLDAICTFAPSPEVGLKRVLRREDSEVEIQPGGPQVSGRPLLLAGKIDFYMGGMTTAIDAVKEGIPTYTIAGICVRSIQRACHRVGNGP